MLHPLVIDSAEDESRDRSSGFEIGRPCKNLVLVALEGKVDLAHHQEVSVLPAAVRDTVGTQFQAVDTRLQSPTPFDEVDRGVAHLVERGLDCDRPVA